MPYRFCNDTTMSSVAKRNDLGQEELELEVLVRGHFHRSDDDLSGAHTTGWVPYGMLKELQEESAVVKSVVQLFLDRAFSISEEAFDCCLPQTFTQNA